MTASSVVTGACGPGHFLPARALSKMASLKLQTGEGCRGRTLPELTENYGEQTLSTRPPGDTKLHFGYSETGNN